MVISGSGSDNDRGGDGGGGDICPSLTEHHFPVYCYSSNTRDMSGGITAVGSKGVTAVVGAERDRPGDRVG